MPLSPARIYLEGTGALQDLIQYMPCCLAVSGPRCRCHRPADIPGGDRGTARSHPVHAVLSCCVRSQMPLSPTGRYTWRGQGHCEISHPQLHSPMCVTFQLKPAELPEETGTAKYPLLRLSALCQCGSHSQYRYTHHDRMLWPVAFIGNIFLP